MRKATWTLLLLFVFAIPWEYSLNLGIPLGNIARFIGLVVLVVAVPAVFQAGRVRAPNTVLWMVAALYLWFCLTCFWTIDSVATLDRLPGYAQEMMIVWLLWEFAENTIDLRSLMRAGLAGSWVLALLTLASFAATASRGGQVRFAAVGQDPNDVARYLDLAFPIAALLFDQERKWAGKLLAIGYLPLGLVAVLVTASRGGFVAAFLALVGCGAILLHKRARRLLSVLFVAPASALVLWFVIPRATLERIATVAEQAQGGDLNQRVNIWEFGWRAFAEAPFLGHGAGTFVNAAGLAPIDTAHNTALSILVEGGMVGFGIAAAILMLMVFNALRTQGPMRMALLTALAVWMLSSLVGTTTESRTTWLLFGMIALAGRLAGEELHTAGASPGMSRQRLWNWPENPIGKSR